MTRAEPRYTAFPFQAKFVDVGRPTLPDYPPHLGQVVSVIAATDRRFDPPMYVVQSGDWAGAAFEDELQPAGEFDDRIRV